MTCPNPSSEKQTVYVFHVKRDKTKSHLQFQVKAASYAEARKEVVNLGGGRWHIVACLKLAH